MRVLPGWVRSVYGRRRSCDPYSGRRRSVRPSSGQRRSVFTDRSAIRAIRVRAGMRTCTRSVGKRVCGHGDQRRLWPYRFSSGHAARRYATIENKVAAAAISVKTTPRL